MTGNGVGHRQTIDTDKYHGRNLMHSLCQGLVCRFHRFTTRFHKFHQHTGIYFRYSGFLLGCIDDEKSPVFTTNAGGRLNGDVNCFKKQFTRHRSFKVEPAPYRSCRAKHLINEINSRL